MVVLPASLLAPMREWRWARISIQAASVLLMGAMALECWGPYRYEYTFGSQRPTVFLSRIVQTPPFDKDLFSSLPYEPYVWGHLKAYGADMSRYVKGAHSEPEAASLLLKAASSAIAENRGAWFVFSQSPIQHRVGPTLLKMGFKAFACVGYPLYIYRPGFRGIPQEQAASLSEVIEFVEKTERPGYGFFLPAARYLREVGEASKADSVLDRALSETELKARIDPSRDQWALEALVQSLCEEKRFDEAAKWLLLYCSLPPYDLGKFVSWLTKDEESRTAILASSNFDFASFLSSYRRSMEKDLLHDDEFKQYWTQWLARNSLQEGKYDDCLAFAQIALDFAQSDLEKILKLMEECELARYKQASADAGGGEGIAGTRSESGSPP
jgi:tetratricopeptide (TPR) repeat protein